jgi:hypothetical protein
MLSLPGEKPCVADPTNRASLPIERAHIPQRSLRSALKRRCTMKPVLMLAFLLTVPVTYAANAKPTEVGCNESCARSYQETMVHQQELKGK